MLISLFLVFFCSCSDETPVGDAATGDTGHTATDASPGLDASASPDADAGTVDQKAAYSCSNPHPAWLLCEDFESGNGSFDAWFKGSKFNDSKGSKDRGRMDLSSSTAHGGKFSLHMPALASADYQGAALNWRKCLGSVQKSPCDKMDSYQQLYFRAWIHLAPDHKNVHHFLNIAGSKPDRFWSLGSAGCLRSGKLSIAATVDLKASTHNTFFYTYFPEMKCSNCLNYMSVAEVDAICKHCATIGMPTCNGPNGKQCCWGTEFHPPQPAAFPLGKWVCFEMMIKANTPNQHDGVMAYWIDNKLVHEKDKMMWRKTSEVALNRVSLQHYNTKGDAKGHSNKVWFDDVVVSKERIGCAY